MNFNALTDSLKDLENCTLCPRNCNADRHSGRPGFCKSDSSFSIASICIHKGEEPAISGTNGICNVFFTNCNLQCIYCQNHQISNNNLSHSINRMDLEEVVSQISDILNQGVNRVGFVSPSHFIPQMKVIIQAIQSMGYQPVWVYNSNGYDKAETLRGLEGMINVYLPDFKYMDAALASKYSGAPDYPVMAMKALKEMYRQKGAALITDDNGCAESGIIVRHLVLPGHVSNSLDVMRFLAGEISQRIHVSLMAQYYPTKNVEHHAVLGRGITIDEYRQVTDEMERLGMFSGWIQEFESCDFYRPDFTKPHPFD